MGGASMWVCMGSYKGRDCTGCRQPRQLQWNSYTPTVCSYLGNGQRPLMGSERQWARKSCWWIVRFNMSEHIRATADCIWLVLLQKMCPYRSVPSDKYSHRTLSDKDKPQVSRLQALNAWGSIWDPSKISGTKCFFPFFSPNNGVSVEWNHLQQHNRAAVVYEAAA